MQRRDFIRLGMAGAAGLAAGGVGLGTATRAARAALPPNDQRVLVSLLLRGGPDYRHLLAPPYEGAEGTYGQAFWSSRYRSLDAASRPGDWEAHWSEDYDQVEVSGVRFGVLKRAGWLASQIRAGNVAIVNNVIGVTSRDHNHGVLAYDAGDRTAGPNDLSRDGWGGRVARQLGGNVVSASRYVRLFCNGPHPTDPRRHDNTHVISARDTREFALYRPEELVEDPASRDRRAIMSRALEGYYAAKRAEMPEESPFRRIVDHEQKLRELGDEVNARLAEVGLPEALRTLYDGDATLWDEGFGLQIRNLFDSFACSDIFGMRVASLLYDGWDSHRAQAASIEPRLEDIFGAGKGLDALFSSLSDTMPSALDNLVLVIGGEFGRQLSDNGDNGTDHGRGNSVLVIGPRVRGGVYGTMFPPEEIELFSEPGRDIEGKTSIEALFGAVADFVEPGLGAAVFPETGDPLIEDGVDLSTLFEG